MNGTTMPGLRTIGRIGRAAGYGEQVNGDGDYGSGHFFGGVYQRYRTGYNNFGWNPDLPSEIRQKRCVSNWSTNPQTEAQQAWRAIFAQAILAWRELTPAELADYKKLAKGANRKVYNYFISTYLKEHRIG